MLSNNRMHEKATVGQYQYAGEKIRLDMLDGTLGRTTEDVKSMVEMLMLDFLGATITGQEVDLTSTYLGRERG